MPPTGIGMDVDVVSLGGLAQGSAAGSEGEQHAAAVKTRISAVAENLLRNKVDMISLVPYRQTHWDERHLIPQ
jgi:hypothetical protein